MSIGKRVFAAIEYMEQGRAEDALVQIAPAMDATAKREITQSTGPPLREFVRLNTGLITKLGIGVQINNFNVECTHPGIPRGPEGLPSLADVFYYAIRCPLLHEAEISKNILFVQDRVIKAGNPLELPVGLVYGFIMATVLADANAEEQCESCSHARFNGLGFSLPINSLWGCKSEVSWLLKIQHLAVRIVVNDDKPGVTD